MGNGPNVVGLVESSVSEGINEWILELNPIASKNGLMIMIVSIASDLGVYIAPGVIIERVTGFTSL